MIRLVFAFVELRCAAFAVGYVQEHVDAQIIRDAISAEDECQDGNGQCSLSALQRGGAAISTYYKRPLEDFSDAGLPDEDPFIESLLQDESSRRRHWTNPPTPAPPVIENCSGPLIAAQVSADEDKGTAFIANGTINSEGGTCPWPMWCIEQLGGGWSQCTDCRPQSFKKVCQKLPDRMRFAAIQKCHQTCFNSKCYNNNWCMKPDHCVKDPEDPDGWGQCVRCDHKTFTASCHAWSESLQDAAHAVCHKRCTYGH